MKKPAKYEGNPIIERGKDGSCDDHYASCCAVLREKGKWRMWYVGIKSPGRDSVLCHAESTNGLDWKKTPIGLVEYDRSKNNNILLSTPNTYSGQMIYEEETKRYIRAAQYFDMWKGWDIDLFGGTIIETSKDGFVWEPVSTEPLIPQQHEAITIYKFNGLYHIGGHQISPLLKLPMQNTVWESI
jgi:hypothetical protein